MLALEFMKEADPSNRLAQSVEHVRVNSRSDVRQRLLAQAEIRRLDCAAVEPLGVINERRIATDAHILEDCRYLKHQLGIQGDVSSADTLKLAG